MRTIAKDMYISENIFSDGEKLLREIDERNFFAVRRTKKEAIRKSSVIR